MAAIDRRLCLTILGTLAAPIPAASQEPKPRLRRCLIPAEPQLSPAELGATLARAEFMIDALRSRGWLDSEERAARFLRYFEHCATGKRDNDVEWREAVVDFVSDNGQSLDWLLSGDVAALICKLGVAAWVQRTEPA